MTTTTAAVFAAALLRAAARSAFRSRLRLVATVDGVDVFALSPR